MTWPRCTCAWPRVSALPLPGLSLRVEHSRTTAGSLVARVARAAAEAQRLELANQRDELTAKLASHLTSAAPVQPCMLNTPPPFADVPRLPWDL